MTSVQVERQTYDVPTAGKILGIGRNSMYEAVKRGEVRAIQIGRRLVIPKAEIDRLLRGDKQAA